ncbi:MerR family transcriptional regulator [Alteribacillus sp. YIM 98480]|uniref:MerR family transcriptional regulator n=1 Tax=Alteribacillus sp. YIM 98480 TaxID=2606599 RepID=UPI00131B8D66|nr:MerR family transcriptional regulator [Alteribacillus sp. YIM 98480]
MKIKELADLVGISVRTLHHYDEIGLFKPEKTTASGHRLYSVDDLEILQQILFYKELGFPLKKIKQIIHSPDFDRQEALELHRKTLLEKSRRINRMLELVEKTIQHSKGEIRMSNKEKFEGFDFSHNPYEQEARERWGDRAVDNSNTKIRNMSKKEQKNLEEEMRFIYRNLADLRHQPPSSQEAQSAIHKWFKWLNTIGDYSLEAFKGLGQLYVDDKRFTKNIDQFGEGLALFMRDAMAVYADNNQH